MDQLDPRIRWVWILELGAVVLGVAVAVAVGVAVLDLPGGLFGIPFAVLLLGAVVAVAYPSARYRRFGYRLGRHALEIAQGVAWRRDAAVPYFRVQHIDIGQGPIERLLGLARLVVHTASAQADATLPGIAADDAPRVRRVLLERTSAAVTEPDDSRDAV